MKENPFANRKRLSGSMNRRKSMIPGREVVMEEKMIHAEITKDGVKINIVNLTPHKITFVTDKGDLIVKPSGSVSRVSSETKETGCIYVSSFFSLRIPVTATVYGEVEGLPAPAKGVIYIVSSLVAQRVPDREDVFIPNESVRDENGRIIGCKSLGHI